MGKKLIRLKPLNPFFFGTNKTFSDETLFDVTSSYFPQQTHLMGMLRMFILQSEGKLNLRRRGRWVKSHEFQEAFSLVGGFDKNDETQTQESFGKIKSLSPLFLVSQKESKVVDFHFVAPKDVGLDVQSAQTKGVVQVANRKRDKHYSIENYDPKVGLVNALTTSEFWSKYSKIAPRKKEKIDKAYLNSLNLIAFDEVFKEQRQVGIKRDKESKTVKENEDGSFYQKTSYMLDEGYEFAFVVEYDGEFKVDEAFVYLGAERSTFRLSIEEYSSALEELYPKVEVSNKEIALSDIEIENFDDIEFMINGDYIAHAHMKRINHKHGKGTNYKSKSNQRAFIPKGSVIYFKEGFNVEEFNSMLGYNCFVAKKEQ